MGMNAELMAIGRFKSEIAKVLEYPEDSYQDVKPGTMIITQVCQMNTSASSRELASILGCDPWDFNTHYLGHAKDVNSEKVEELTELTGPDMDAFAILRDAGFVFFFVPNG